MASIYVCLIWLIVPASPRADAMSTGTTVPLGGESMLEVGMSRCTIRRFRWTARKGDIAISAFLIWAQPIGSVWSSNADLQNFRIQNWRVHKNALFQSCKFFLSRPEPPGHQILLSRCIRRAYIIGTRIWRRRRRMPFRCAVYTEENVWRLLTFLLENRSYFYSVI